jgi:hypothetical protein
MRSAAPSRARVIAIALLVAAAAGCAKTHARTPAPSPALAAPEPPDRVIVPITLAAPIEAAPAAPAPAVPAPAPRATPPRAAERPTEQTSPPAAPRDAAPPPVLQTTSNPAEMEQRARGLIADAQRALDRVARDQLSANARAQYDTATSFIRQADAALKIRNVVLAQELAQKASALASQLPRR